MKSDKTDGKWKISTQITILVQGQQAATNKLAENNQSQINLSIWAGIQAPGNHSYPGLKV